VIKGEFGMRFESDTLKDLRPSSFPQAARSFFDRKADELMKRSGLIDGNGLPASPAR
jgi:hypothetical protein